ncbi:hypothetical protein WS70_19560 [Burkholderia mayonis]|uniref:OmpR/PhoB-type domain-containing protein n=1 Tax=Burkholderia mayonis TaxID=1385591 RepID=A0A1B4FK86_9BURK|nr:winged helix-turn-helix domain-containing protein [Burkholderia mayonis]AOJ04085.1 hypothetical protein WS70_19560 [Burkholderia mayonis]KVE46104.1 hypothetical protein WS70_02890 [Burkholderia mayonis]
MSAEATIALGRFELDMDRRVLTDDGDIVHIGSRAFDILAALASADGRLVTKDELMQVVWPDTVVEENNIQVHLSAVRKALGRDRDLIITIPGRGYQLVQRRREAAVADAPCTPASAMRGLPMQKIRLIGRDDDVKQAREMLDRTRVLTLTGAGGIGKTSLGIEVARGYAATGAADVCFVELAASTDRATVLAALAESCGVSSAGSGGDAARIASALAGPRRLLVLDNAEQVIADVAAIVETLIATNDALRVLVTSREPLRIVPEAVFQVDPLDVPAADADDADILAHSAVRLFFSRANALRRTLGTRSAEIRVAGEICRRLDGIPLAIELAAARAATLGLDGVYRRLDDRLALLCGGHRTALPRHQTLRATFDWSFALLDRHARAVFRRLAMFGGLFTFDAMCAVVCDADLTIGGVIAAIDELVAKSLVAVEFDGPVAKYRLPESTRAYALEKLMAEGERQQIAARYARYLTACFDAGAAGSVRARIDDASALRQTLDDARSAFDWAFSPDGNPRLGIELAASLVGALLDGGTIDECGKRDDALAHCRSSGEAPFLPEVRRALGAVAYARAQARDGPDGVDASRFDAAHACFGEANDLARAQGAATRTLRATIAQARLLLADGRAHEAADTLRALAAHFDPALRARDVRRLFDLVATLPADP